LPTLHCGRTTCSTTSTSCTVKLDRYARSSALAPTVTLPPPGATDQFQGEPTTVHQPPVSALAQPLATLRRKLSAAIVAGGGGGGSAVAW
jgi:hypothetical protein